MKDTVLTAARKKKELFFAVCSFAAAVLLNIICIASYHTPWYEVFTQIGFTTVIAVVFYMGTVFVRVVVWLCKKKTEMGAQMQNDI